jgi:recombination protein RecA
VFDEPWAALHGVDLDNLFVYTPTSAEDVADAMKDMLMSGLFSMVVLDSIGAMIPEAEKEKDADKAVMAQQAKIVTRMVKIAAVEANRTQTTVILINQVRANLAYGADTTTGGGFALKHCSTMKFKVSRTGTPPFKAKFGNEEMVVGHEIKIRVERNKVSTAYRDATVVLYHKDSKHGAIGIDKVDEAVTMGISHGGIEQGGAWYTMPNGERLQGRDAVVEFVRQDPSQIQLIRDKIFRQSNAPIIENDIEEDIAEIGDGDE